MYPPSTNGQPFMPVYAPAPMVSPYQTQYSYSNYGNYQPFMNAPQPMGYPYNYNMSFGVPAPNPAQNTPFNPYQSPIGIGSYNNPYGDITGRPAVQSNGLVFKDTRTSAPIVNVEPVDSGSAKGYDDNYIYDNVTGEYRPADGSQFFPQNDTPQQYQQPQMTQPQQSATRTILDFVHRAQPQQSMFYGYGYNYNPYAYNTYVANPMAVQKRQNEVIELRKLRIRMAAGYMGRNIEENQLDAFVNPANPLNTRTEQEEADYKRYQMVKQFNELGMRPVQPLSQAEINAIQLNRARQSFDENYGNDDMFTFFNQHSWRIFTEIHEHEDYRDYSRNLNSTYSSADYTELLNMHNSSNPYINQLMDDSRYDNNQDDLEIGVNLAFERFKRNQAVRNNPTGIGSGRYISSPEIQQKRAAWTQQILEQIARKGKPQDS